MGVPSATRKATGVYFGPPAARSTDSTTPVRISVQLGFLKPVELTVAGRESSVFSQGSVSSCKQQGEVPTWETLTVQCACKSRRFDNRDRGSMTHY